MNRLVIIGNGFDLANGLPTSYRDFIDDFWKNLEEYYNYDLVKRIIYFNIKHRDFKDYYCYNLKSYDDFVNRMIDNSNKKNINFDRKKIVVHDMKDSLLFYFTNEFFKILCNKTIGNWVDIENIYYDILKEKVRGSFIKYNYPWDIKQLNEELEQVKNLLEIYLNQKVINNYNLDFTKNNDIDWNKIYNKLKPISLLNKGNVLDEFIKKEDKKEIEEHFEKEKKEILVNNLYFLNFNYTPIAKKYCDLLNKDESIDSKINFIHGELNNTDENKINFGFGDEMDDDHKIIENINDNEYLKNFKSFQYLQNSNYSNLLSYIDSDKFQVVVMGHSCGLSDRTLLNTIFEHNNCRSIKVYYYQWKDEETNEIKDNYTEIIQNISRHFNKKKLMREKIVNKTLCQPLLEVQSPKK